MGFKEVMRDALALTRQGDVKGATERLRRALGASEKVVVVPVPVRDAAPVTRLPPPVVVPAPAADPDQTPAPPSRGSGTQSDPQFRAGSFTNKAGSRHYKLWIPSAAAASGPRPLLVMLHGCTQSSEDFAAGTRMNRLAEGTGCYVLYPEQDRRGNPKLCWNWFQRGDQSRNSGEPSLIADMTRQVMREHPIDAARVSVAGLSAGGAMAVILGETYPDLFSAVGVHSGLPTGVANDLPSALAAMKGRVNHTPDLSPSSLANAPRLIVFHGDRDHTVAVSNGAAIVAAALARSGPLERALEEGSIPNGHSYRRTRYRDARGLDRIEHWVVQGAAHAWSGGDPAGSYTDPRGPDASAAMLRFFLEA